MPQGGCSPCERKKALRNEVRKRIKICKANEERKRIEKIDRDFRNKCPSRFRTSKSNKFGSKIRVSGDIVSDPPAVLQAWRGHFEMLGKARDENDTVKAANDRAKHLLELTYANEEVALDAPENLLSEN